MRTLLRRATSAYGFTLVIAVIVLLSVACASEVSVGEGSLPADTQTNLVPNVDFVGYLYFNPSTSSTVDIRRFLPSGGAEVLAADVSESAEVSSATILTSTEGDVAASLKFLAPKARRRATICTAVSRRGRDMVQGGLDYASCSARRLDMGNERP